MLETVIEEQAIWANRIAEVIRIERFRQGDQSTTRAHGGLGLGLAIIKRFIEAHGGRVRIESNEGKGSKFRFTLPMKAEREQPTTRSIAAAHAVPVIHDYDNAGKVTEDARARG